MRYEWQPTFRGVFGQQKEITDGRLVGTLILEAGVDEAGMEYSQTPNQIVLCLEQAENRYWIST